MSALKCCELVVKKSAISGYGVFADQDILTGETIEECHFIISETSTDFENYLYKTASGEGLALGLGSIYNHSDTPNAVFQFDRQRNLMVFSALEFIKKGDEIFTCYGSNWFKGRALKRRERGSIRARIFTQQFVRFFILTVVLYGSVWLLQYSTR